MKIRILVPADPYQEGDVLNVDSHTGAGLISEGKAVEVKVRENATSKKAKNALLAAKHRTGNDHQ